MKLGQIRKAVAAAVPPLLPLLAYACSVAPASHIPLGTLVFFAVLGELGAAGVYALKNDPMAVLESEVESAVLAKVDTPAVSSFTGAADQPVPPPA